jgi:uncharacterized protein (TIGR02246 family)
MSRFTCFGFSAAVLACAALGAQPANVRESPAGKAATGQPPATQPAKGQEQLAVEKALQDYAAAFNKHDAAAVAAFWSPTGSYEDRDTGERLDGREAIQEDLGDLFKRQPGVNLVIQVDRVRLIGRDVAKADGEATVTNPGEEPRTVSFSAIHVRQDGRWLLDSTEETSSTPPMTAKAALKELDWLVGTWRDESDEVRVETTVRWARTGSFLIRSYTIRFKGDEQPREGTQVIGWDPRNRQIHSWNFESDGSFGEGVWSRSGDEWRVRLTHTSEDGSLSSATQVITRINNDRLKVQMVGREIDGEPLPTGEPVMVDRVPSSESLSSTRR